MRPSSGSSSLLSALILLVVASCASAPPSSSSREQFDLSGTLQIEGTHPFDRAFILVDGQEVRWLVDPGAHLAELSLLDGYELLLTCTGVSGRQSERDAKVESYLLIPPDGMTALLGILSSSAGMIELLTDEKRIALEGPLAGTLAGFGGNRVWVWGEVDDGDAFVVSGYEVLGP